MVGAKDSIGKVLFLQTDPEVLENARKQDQASFFEDERLAGFLHLEWDIEVEKDLVLEFIENYNVTSRMATMRAGELLVADELMLEVFHLPRGTHKMSKKIRGRIVSRHFPAEGRGFVLNNCRSKVWKARYIFLHDLFCIRTRKREMTRYFMQFLQAEGKKRNWLDAFRYFFEAEIRRIQKSKEATTSTTIGSHISLLLAHIRKKKRPQSRVPNQKRLTDVGVATHKADRKDLGPQRVIDDDKDEERDEEPERSTIASRVTRRRLAPKKICKQCQEPQSSSDDDGEEDDNEAAEGKGEEQNHQEDAEEEQCIHPSLNTVNVEDQILRHYDMGRQGIDELLNRVAGLRNENDSLKKEVELWKNDYGNRVGAIRNEKDVLKKEVELLKSDYGDRIGAIRNEKDALKKEVELLKSDYGDRVGAIRNEKDALKKEMELFKRDYGNWVGAILNRTNKLKNEVERWKIEHENQTNEVELWKIEYGNRTGVIQNENNSLKNEVEKWKSECVKAEEARKLLKAKITALWETSELGTTNNTSKLTRTLSEDNTSSGFASPPPSKKAKKTETSPKTEVAKSGTDSHNQDRWEVAMDRRYGKTY